MSKNNIKVSIITPVFNSKEYFEQTFNCVVNQTYKNWEWIIVDDCSTDGSSDFITSLVKEFPEKSIKLLKTDKNSGAAVARNLAINQATGDFIAFLDADDLWELNKLELQVNFMEIHGYEFTYGAYKVVGKHKNIIFSPKQSFSYKEVLKGCDIGCLTVMYDVRKLGKVYMPVNAYLREDCATWLNILRTGVIAYSTNQILGTYFLRTSSVSRKKIKMVKYHWKMLRNTQDVSAIKSIYYIKRNILHKMFKKY